MGKYFVVILVLFFLMAHAYHHVSEYSSNISYEDINDGDSIIERFIRRVRSIQEDYTKVKTIKKLHPEQERYKRSSPDAIIIDSYSEDGMLEDPNIKIVKLEDLLLEDASVEDESLEKTLLEEENAKSNLKDVKVERDLPKIMHKLILSTINPSTDIKIENNTEEFIDATTEKKPKESPDCCVGDEILTETPFEPINPTDDTLKIKIVIEPQLDESQDSRENSRLSRRLLTYLNKQPQATLPFESTQINPPFEDPQPEEGFPYIKMEVIPVIPNHSFQNPVPVLTVDTEKMKNPYVKTKSTIFTEDDEMSDEDDMSDGLSHAPQLFNLDVKANPTDSLEPKSKKHNINNMIRSKRSASDSPQHHNPSIENNPTKHVTGSNEGPRQDNPPLSKFTPSMIRIFGPAYLRPNTPPLSLLSIYLEKVRTGVNVEETQKNPERRIYGYVE